ncbi:MAG: glycosyltransferase [Candidatus Njordarchaeia archaeon]
MKVVLMSDVYLPFLSGVCTAVYVLSRELPRHGVDLTLAVPSPSFGLGKIVDDYANRKVIMIPSTSLHGLYGEMRFPVRFYDAREEIVDGETVFNVHSPMIFGTAAVKKLRRLRDKDGLNFGIVGVFHSRMDDYLLKRVPKALAKKLARGIDFYIKHIFNRMDLTTTPSTHTKAIGLRLGIRNIITLPNPLNRAHYMHPKKRIDEIYDFLEPKKYFLWLGRISHEKRIHILPELFCKKLKNDIKFVFGGEGPLLNYLKKKYENKNCIFLGRVPPENQKPLYRDAIAFISASDWETQGLTFVEAMAQGTPVIAYKEGGQMDFLKHMYNSLIFEKDIQILEYAELLRKNEDLRERLGKNALKTAMRYHPDNIIPKYIKVYKWTLEKVMKY